MSKKDIIILTSVLSAVAAVIVAFFIGLNWLMNNWNFQGEWEYELINDYEACRFSNEDINISIKTGPDTSRRVIEPYIVYFCYNDRYIGAIRINDKDTEQIEENFRYYLIDTEENIVILKDASKLGYERSCSALGIDDMCDWIATVPMPKGAKM